MATQTPPESTLSADPIARHPRLCTALRKRDGQPCGHWATKGSNVCKYHGGAAPQVREAGLRRLAAQRAVADLEQMGVAIETTEAEALTEMLYESAGNVAAVRAKVQALTSMTGPEAEAILERYDRERDRLQRFAKDFAALGIAERKQQLAELEMRRLAAAVQSAKTAAMMTPEQAQAFDAAFAAALRSDMKEHEALLVA